MADRNHGSVTFARVPGAAAILYSIRIYALITGIRGQRS